MFCADQYLTIYVYIHITVVKTNSVINVMSSTTSSAKNHSSKAYRKIKNYLFWEVVLLGILAIVVVSLCGLIMMMSEVQIQEMITNSIHLKGNITSMVKQELKGKMFPICDWRRIRTYCDESTVSRLHAKHQNVTNWYRFVINSSKHWPKVAPAIVAVHGSINDDFSNCFYTSDDGHLMRLKVYPNGRGKGKDTHVSVFLHLMNGSHDDKLEQSGHWPLRGTFTIELLNQLNDSDHYINTTFDTKFPHDYITGAGEDNDITKGWGISQFISHDSLPLNDSYCHYSNDPLYFRISYNQIAPVTIKFPVLTMKAGTVKQWISNPFFAFEGGYQMCLKVHYIRNNNIRMTKSANLHLMKGPHDDKLEQSGHWPLRGTFTIELLNDGGHYMGCFMVQFHHHLCSECTNRVLEGVKATNGRSIHRFISHNTLFNHSSNNYQGNILFYKISYEDVNEAPYQVAPMIFKITKFTQWLKSKSVWYSSPFFAFEKGYKMYLHVYAAGYGDGEGTHVSVFLHLMKGPHDDELEQSGCWPLRGTFTIELLNQLNDSDHYSHEVTYGTEADDDYINRVVEDNRAAIGWGHHQFISHNILFNLTNSAYLMNDILNFRISYEFK